MWKLIGELVGLVNTGAKTDAAQYAALQGEYAADVDYSRAKEMSYYQGYAYSSKTITYAAIAGFIFLAVVLFLATRKSK